MLSVTPSGKVSSLASGGTDPPPEPNGAGPSSTHARHGTVFGTAPGVSVQLTPNCLLSGLFSRMRYPSCNIFVSPGSCSDSSRNFVCETGAGALCFPTGSGAGYPITGARAANETVMMMMMVGIQDKSRSAMRSLLLSNSGYLFNLTQSSSKTVIPSWVHMDPVCPFCPTLAKPP